MNDLEHDSGHIENPIEEIGLSDDLREKTDQLYEYLLTDPEGIFITVHNHTYWQSFMRSSAWRVIMHSESRVIKEAESEQMRQYLRQRIKTCRNLSPIALLDQEMAQMREEMNERVSENLSTFLRGNPAVGKRLRKRLQQYIPS